MIACHTVHVTADVKRKLDELKQHKRETYNDVIERLIAFYEIHRELKSKGQVQISLEI